MAEGTAGLPADAIPQEAIGIVARKRRNMRETRHCQQGEKPVTTPVHWLVTVTKYGTPVGTIACNALVSSATVVSTKAGTRHLPSLQTHQDVEARV